MIKLVFTTEGQMRTCFVCSKGFASKKFGHILENGGHVCPACARSRGFEIDDAIKPPRTIRDRSQLGDWLTKDLGIDRNSDTYLKLYEKFSYLPQKNFLKSDLPDPDSHAGRELKLRAVQNGLPDPFEVQPVATFEEVEPELERPDLFSEVATRFKSEYDRIAERLAEMESETIKALVTPEKTALHCKRDGGGTMVCRGEKAL